jgi:hypothetical protein
LIARIQAAITGGVLAEVERRAAELGRLIGVFARLTGVPDREPDLYRGLGGMMFAEMSVDKQVMMVVVVVVGGGWWWWLEVLGVRVFLSNVIASTFW